MAWGGLLTAGADDPGTKEAAGSGLRDGVAAAAATLGVLAGFGAAWRDSVSTVACRNSTSARRFCRLCFTEPKPSATLFQHCCLWGVHSTRRPWWGWCGWSRPGGCWPGVVPPPDAALSAVWWARPRTDSAGLLSSWPWPIVWTFSSPVQ